MKKKFNNFILVLVDESKELHQALYFACKRAMATNSKIALLFVIPPTLFNQWAGVTELMQKEAREFAEEKLRVHAEFVQKITGMAAVIYIKQGVVTEKIIELIDEDKKINILFLGANTKPNNANPVISYLCGKGISKFRVPLVIVPGNLTDEQIDEIY